MAAGTAESETYNGWKNYPTWNVNLWLGNDEGLYNATIERVEQAYNEGLARSRESDLPASPRVDVADALKSFVRDELAPDLGASFVADLLGYALDQVDWFEIADSWLEDLAQ